MEHYDDFVSEVELQPLKRDAKSSSYEMVYIFVLFMDKNQMTLVDNLKIKEQQTSTECLQVKQWSTKKQT